MTTKGHRKRELNLVVFYTYLGLLFLFLLSSLLFMKPVITGHVVYSSVNDTLHTLPVNGIFNSTTEVPFELKNVTSFGVQATIEGDAEVRIYLEHNGTKYLVAQDEYGELINRLI